MGDLLEDRVRDENIILIQAWRKTKQLNEEISRLRQQLREKASRLGQQLIEEASRSSQNLLLPYSLSASFWYSDLREKRPIPELRTSTGSAVFCPGTVGFASRSTSSTLLMPSESPHHADGGDMIKNRMEQRMVRIVLKMGFDRKSVMKAIEWRLREIGDDYPSAEALLNAVLTLKENPKAFTDATHDLTPYDIPQPHFEPSRHTRYSFSKAAPVEPNEAGYFKAESDLRTSAQQKMCFERRDVKKAGTSKTYILSEKEIKNASFERDKHGNQNISAESKKAPVEPNEADYFKAELDWRTSTQQKMCFERLDVKKTGNSKTYILREKEKKNASFERDKHGNQNISAESKKDLIQLDHSVFLNLMKILFATIYLMSFLAQVDCQICQDTLKSVPRCPLNAEEYNMESKKCSIACQTSQNDASNMYEYHCLRNTDKTELIEVCAVSQYLFDYCPEYDPVGKIIQMDLSTNCNSNSTQSYYSSSDIFHCDVKCFLLYEKQDVVNATRIPVTNETKTPDDGEENITGSITTAIYWLIAILAVTGITAVFSVWIMGTKRRATKRKTEREEKKMMFECTMY